MYLTSTHIGRVALLVASAAASALPNTGSASLSQVQDDDYSGKASFYGGNPNGGQCSFSTYTIPSGIYGTALSSQNWNNSANCGACLDVTGPSGNNITVMIVDICPGCDVNQLDLFPDAFDALANPDLGIIPITWSFVDCPFETPLQIHNKEGTSQYWFSMQVVGGNQATADMQVSPDGGNTWLTPQRQTYNFFQLSGGTGTDTVDVKVTSSSGQVVTVPNVPNVGGESVTASSNYV